MSEKNSALAHIVFQFCVMFFVCFRLPKIKEYVDKNDPGGMIIPFSGAFELNLVDFGTDDERKAYCEERKSQRSVK